MKVNISTRFLIFNAHQQFLDEFFKEGINYTYSGLDLGLGVIFVSTLDEVVVNSSLFLPLFVEGSFLWIAFSNSAKEQALLSELQIISEMSKIGLQCGDSILVGDGWKMIRFSK